VTITSSDGSLTLPVTFTVTAKSSTGRSAEVWRSRPRPDESAF
jgi:hypothetical protein